MVTGVVRAHPEALRGSMTCGEGSGRGMMPEQEGGIKQKVS